MCKLAFRRAWMQGLTACFLFFIIILNGCQTYTGDNLPAPSVREVQWSRSHQINTAPPARQVKRTDFSFYPASWIPASRQRQWEGIMIHHSALDSGDAISYDIAHKQRGWDGLGYHFVINNGNNGHSKRNGEIEVGWRWRNQREGAHCRVNPNDNNYWNEHTIGICLVGNFERYPPSEAQWQSLIKLVYFLQKRYGIPNDKIVGHRDADSTTCPGRHLSLWDLKRRLNEYASNIYLTDQSSATFSADKYSLSP